jgi:hypothetical protein
MNKILNFDKSMCKLEVSMTTVILIKCSGLTDLEAVMDFVTSKLKCRINEIEFKINDLTKNI